MEYQQARSLTSKLSRAITFLSILVLALLLVNALLGLLLWHQSGKKEIVLVPANLHTRASITQSGVSRSYLEAMAMMLVSDRLNITPETVAGSNQALLRFVDAQFYIAFKKQLAQEKLAIINGKIASTFYLNTLQAHPHNNEVIIRGQLKRWVGLRLISQQSKTYRLQFGLTGTPLLLQSFEELTKET